MRSLILFIIAAGLFVTVSDVGAVAQVAYPNRPIWALVLLADVCLLIFVIRLWKRSSKTS
jgi:hypothetical protein